MIGTKEECILQYNHAKIFESGKEIVMLDSNMPMWTEIIHESNVTNRIKEMAKIMDMNFLDHIIIGGNDFVSCIN